MGENIRLTAADGFELGAYRARPDGAVKGGVVVVQEIFGVNVHIRSVCDRYAEAGYLAVAPAIYDRIEPDVQIGYEPDDIARGRDIRAKADMANVIADVAAAADAAAEGGKVGIVGYCWGGLIVYLAACRLGDKLACASGYYGGGIVSYLDEKPAVPLMLHFGSLDASIPLSEVERIDEAYPEVAVHVYEGADHGFNCDRRAQYNAEAAAQARERTLGLFAEHLG
ncbi:MAG: dienelactone hydrolase family protein [Proteobacteria bacterium]|nr:dienelactone hydrolase family protein [Pseudomonadota bacterium]